MYRFLLLIIITIPSFVSLLNNAFFSMHDDQHIARLFLLDKAIRQGYFYPRWVDGLGFGYGYPLFNFYPPLVYYVGEFFHLLGASFIWSIKLVFILGFILAAYGMYRLAKRFVGEIGAYLAASFYTFFTYHAVVSYVRGALAEFFSMALLPFLFEALFALGKKQSAKQTIIFGTLFALLILNHPLIALPSLFFVFFIAVSQFLFQKTKRKAFVEHVLAGEILGLALSSFFWLPSMVERKFTLVDTILIRELASYKLHYVFSFQFWYSPWGYGGSIEGLSDGMTFQLGKVHLVALLLTVIAAVWYWIKKRRADDILKYFGLLLSLFLFALFMTTSYSGFIWDNVKYLWYLQFPWRFLVFVGIFLALSVSFLPKFLEKLIQNKIVTIAFSVVLIGSPIFFYSKYFVPQDLIYKSDAELTSYEEVAWRVSMTSHEFIPKGVKTGKTDFNTTMLAVNKEGIAKNAYKILRGDAKVTEVKNKMMEKEFTVYSTEGASFQLQTYHFPGWVAYLDGNTISIRDNNKFKLITVEVSKGQHRVSFKFNNTVVRSVANTVSLLSLLLAGIVYFRTSSMR